MDTGPEASDGCNFVKPGGRSKLPSRLWGSRSRQIGFGDPKYAPAKMESVTFRVFFAYRSYRSSTFFAGL